MDIIDKKNIFKGKAGQAADLIKIGIYDRYLSTGGGGERYSCKMAEILSKEPGFKVDLISDLFSDLNTIEQRLNLDLSRVSLKIFPFLSEEYAAKITGAYDIFINATYLSSLCGHAASNIYLCYFPTPFDVDFKGLHRFLLIFFRLPAIWLYRFADRISSSYSGIEVLEGLYDIKRFMLRRGVWSSGSVSLKYGSSPKNIRIGLKNPPATGIKSMRCSLKLYALKSFGNQMQDKATQIYSREFFIPENKKYIEDIEPKSINHADRENNVNEYLLTIQSDTFVSKNERDGRQDSRNLGVVIYNEEKTSIFKKFILKILGFVPLFLVTFPKDFGFLKTYDRIISISEYSKKWLKKLWKTESEILYPPVDTERFFSNSKKKIIISVGRFFPQHHNKKQLELAESFMDLYKSCKDVMSGYRLILAGGVENIKEHLEYVEKIKQLSRSYPIEVLTNIKWEKLREIFSEALIFWHASGMGEDENRHPEKFEHFGITTVEAMASGAIPVVINRGGQPEIIDNGKNGFLFNSWDEMKKITLDICSSYNRSENGYDKISMGAVVGAERFSEHNFKKRLLEIIGDELIKVKRR